jgi:hypothetical protein
MGSSPHAALGGFFHWTSDVPLPRVTWLGMKLKNIIPQRYRSQVIRRFGNAKLLRRPNGQHELIGGTDADRADAFEWSSLFAHEIVFTHFHREDRARRRPQILLTFVRVAS